MKTEGSGPDMTALEAMMMRLTRASEERTEERMKTLEGLVREGLKLASQKSPRAAVPKIETGASPLVGEPDFMDMWYRDEAMPGVRGEPMKVAAERMDRLVGGPPSGMRPEEWFRTGSSGRG